MRLESEPPGAVVEWNGKFLGRTPLQTEMPAGPQAVRISLDGYVGREAVIEVVPNAKEPLSRMFPLQATGAPKAAPPPPVIATAHVSSSRAAPAARSAPVAKPVASTAPPTTPSAKPRPNITLIGD